MYRIAILLLVPYSLNLIFAQLFTETCFQNLTRGQAARILRIDPVKVDARFRKCALMCIQNSFCEIFDQVNETCLLYSKNNLLESVHYQGFGEVCNRSVECGYSQGECLQGSCSCSIGYSYNFHINTCVKECDEYGSQFSMYVDSGIEGCNTNETVTNTSLECMTECLNNNYFVCITVEFNTNTSQCHLCDKPFFAIPVVNRENGTVPNWLLYIRHCKEV